MRTEIQLVAMLPNERPEAFSRYKNALSNVVQDAFGWDENFQQERFQNKYDPDWFYWIQVDSQRIGYVCFWEKDLETHVSLLIIETDKRGQGYGREVMLHLHSRAQLRSSKITLSSFRNNTAAIRFYESLGYKTTGGDDFFVDMAWATS